MTTALATQNGNGAGSLVSNMWSPEQVQILKQQVAYPEITNEELAHFSQVCGRTGLDPFARQIYAVGRWDSRLKREKMTVQVSIDGFRLQADRSGKYSGSETYWCGSDGQWVDVWLSNEPPKAAKTIVYKGGSDKPFAAVALWNSYVQTKKDGSPTSMWARMPDVMIAKCSEALALRKAFPAELSGLYSREEMMQADNPAVEAQQSQTNSTPAKRNGGRKISPAQRKRLYAISQNHNWSDEAVKALILQVAGVESSTDIPIGTHYDTICNTLETAGKAEEYQAFVGSQEPEVVEAEVVPAGPDEGDQASADMPF